MTTADPFTEKVLMNKDLSGLGNNPSTGTIAGMESLILYSQVGDRTKMQPWLAGLAESETKWMKAAAEAQQNNLYWRTKFGDSLKGTVALSSILRARAEERSANAMLDKISPPDTFAAQVQVAMLERRGQVPPAF